MKNVVTFAAGENLLIGHVNDQVFAYANVKLLPEYKISQNFVNNFTTIVVTKSNERVYVTFFYKNADGLHMTTMNTEFEVVQGMI